MLKKKLGQRGFTLIELLVVIAIIGILSSVVLVSLNSARVKARDAKRIADIAAIQTALALYFDTNSEYAPTIAALSPDFLATPPVPPLTGEVYSYSTSDATQPLSYHLGATLEGVTTGGVLAGDSDCNSNNATAPFCSGFDSTGTATPFDGTDDAAAPFVGCVATQAGVCYDVTP